MLQPLTCMKQTCRISLLVKYCYISASTTCKLLLLVKYYLPIVAIECLKINLLIAIVECAQRVIIRYKLNLL